MGDDVLDDQLRQLASQRSTTTSAKQYSTTEGVE